MQNESEKSLFIRSFQSGMVKAIAYQVTIFALPFVLAALTFAAGAIDKSTPWMWVLTATCLSFAGVATGILRFRELLHKNRIEGNLVCTSPRIAIDLTDSNSYSLGLNLQSTGEVPIEFEIGKIITKLHSKYPPKKPFELSRFTIPSRGIGFFNDNAIRLPDGSRRSANNVSTIG